MWCVPYPGKPDQTLVLLDTEGLGDVEKVIMNFGGPGGVAAPVEFLLN